MNPYFNVLLCCQVFAIALHFFDIFYIENQKHHCCIFWVCSFVPWYCCCCHWQFRYRMQINRCAESMGKSEEPKKKHGAFFAFPRKRNILYTKYINLLKFDGIVICTMLHYTFWIILAMAQPMIRNGNEPEKKTLLIMEKYSKTKFSISGLGVMHSCWNRIKRRGKKHIYLQV